MGFSVQREEEKRVCKFSRIPLFFVFLSAYEEKGRYIINFFSMKKFTYLKREDENFSMQN